MKIRYISRISGWAKVAYAKHTMEVEEYRILSYGDQYFSPIEDDNVTYYGNQGLYTPNGVFELKTGSKVTVL